MSYGRNPLLILGLAFALAACRSAPPEATGRFISLDPRAPVPPGELRQQADHITAVFQPQSDIARIQAHETFALGVPAPLLVRHVKVQWQDDAGVVHLVLFPFDSAALRPEAETALRDFIRRHRERIASVQIEGRADSTGTAAYNQALGQRRAAQVAQQIAALGVPAERIQQIALGETAPLASNATAAGRQQNRSARVTLDARDAPGGH